MGAHDADVIELVRMHLGAESVSPGARIVEDLGAESADIVNIIGAVEDRFSFAIREEDIPGIRTVGDLIDLVSRRDAGP